MKINELNEGPIDFARKVGAGVKGFAQGGVTGMGAGVANQQAIQSQNKMTATVAQNAYKQWAAVAQSIKNSTGKDANSMQAHDWLKNFMGGVEPKGAPPNTSPAVVNKWLYTEVSNYIANKELAKQNIQQRPAADGSATTAQQSTAPQPQTVKTAAPTAQEPISIAGQKLDPKNPAHAELIKQAQAADTAQQAQLPDISQLTKGELMQLKAQLQAV